MTTTTSLESLTEYENHQELLLRLKDLKNSVIGNVWKKVEVSNNKDVIDHLLSLLKAPESGIEEEQGIRWEIICESTAILGALSNNGSITLKPLHAADAPSKLINLIHYLVSVPPRDISRDKIMPLALRALRNILVSTADTVWGHMWGVGAERRVVETGLEEVSLDTRNQSDIVFGSSQEGKGKGVNREEVSTRKWRFDADIALGLIFQSENLEIFLSLLSSNNPQITLPLYQLFSRLSALPSNRECLIAWSDDRDTLSSTDRFPSVLESLLLYISQSHSQTPSTSVPGFHKRPNPKILEAALDLLASLVRGSAKYAKLVRNWIYNPLTTSRFAPDAVPMPSGSSTPREYTSNSKVETERMETVLLELLKKGTSGVQIAAAGCLTNIIKADETSRNQPQTFHPIKEGLLSLISRVLKSNSKEDTIKICFILAALVSDDEELQRAASLAEIPPLVVDIVVSLQPEESDELAYRILHDDVSTRIMEATILSLASLSGNYEPTRSYLAEIKPTFLIFVKNALRHPSYGVRAASCQLARSMSRTVAILRTSLVDAQIGSEIIRLLKRERTLVDESPDEELPAGERSWTVEVAATAVICNLVTDFSPLKLSLLAFGGIEVLCQLSLSPHEPLALNALWALKNLMFHETESMKQRVISCLGLDQLKLLMSASTSVPLRAQGFEITQNLLADSQPADIGRVVDMFGETDLLNLLVEGGRATPIEIRSPALYVLSNLSLGNERTRNAITARTDILDLLSSSLTSLSPKVVIPALRALRHLVESNVKSRKPRIAVCDLLQPYDLRSTLVEMTNNPSLDVSQASALLLSVLERAPR